MMFKKLRCLCAFLLVAILMVPTLGASAYAGQREPVDIAMVLFRGITNAENGFLDTIKKSPEFDVNVKIFDTEQNPTKLQEVIGQLEKGHYRLIYVFGTTATQQIMKRIKETPIVFNIVQRPIEAGIINGWDSSGNNITGASNYVAMQSAFKTIGMLMHIHKLGFMFYDKDPSTGYQRDEILQQQRKFGFSIAELPIHSKETISQTLKQMLDVKPDAVMIPADSFIKANGDAIFSALKKHRIPSIVIIPEMVTENGALLALGPDYYTLGQLAAENALEILRGKKPSELPIRRVSHLNLVINQSTADKLGISTPLQLLRLSEVVRGTGIGSIAKKVDSFFSTDTIMGMRGIIPCMVIIFIGFLVGKADRSAHEKTFTSMIFFVFSPCLVFSGIHRHLFSYSEAGSLALAAILAVLLLIPPSLAVKRINKIPDKGYVLPILFTSSGTLLMPLAYLLYGNEGLAKAALFHLFSTFLFHTLGAWLVDGCMQPQRFIRNPTFFAALIGIMSTELNLSLPASMEGFFHLIERGIDLVGYGAIPFLLLSFGYPFSKIDLVSLRKGLAGGAARMFMAPAVAFLTVLLLRQLGLLSTARGYNLLDYIDKRTTEAVIIMAGTLPGAMSCYLLSLRSTPDKVKDTLAVLLVASIIGLVSIPLSLFMINRFILSG